MADALRAIQNLPLVTWRGLEAPPYDTAGFSFSHSHGVNLYPYVSQGTHNWAGLNPLQMPFRFFFINGVDNRIDWFPDLYNQWWPALEDGARGELQHPLLGKIDAVVRGGGVTLEARATAGVIVDVTFERTLDDPEAELAATQLQLNLDALIEVVVGEVSNRNIQAPNERPVTDLGDLGKQISGFIDQVDLAVAGAISSAKGLVSSYVQAVRDLADPELAYTEQVLLATWTKLDDLGKSLAATSRATSAFTTTADTTISAIAREKKNSDAEIITLNTDLLALPIVPRGTSVRYYS